MNIFVGDRVWRPTTHARSLKLDVTLPIDTYLVSEVDDCGNLLLSTGDTVSSAGWELYPNPGDRVVISTGAFISLYGEYDLQSWTHQICIAGRSCCPPEPREHGYTRLVPREGFAGACIEVQSPDRRNYPIAVACLRVYERSRA